MLSLIFFYLLTASPVADRRRVPSLVAAAVHQRAGKSHR